MLSQSASKPKFEKLLISRNQPEIRLARLVKAFWKPFASLLKDIYKKPCKTRKLLKYLQKSFLANVNAPLDVERLEEFELETCPGDFRS